MKRAAKRNSGFLIRTGPPIRRGRTVRIPGFSGSRPLLSFTLKVLAGKDRTILREHLAFWLSIDFQFRTPEMDAALKSLDARPELLDHAVDKMIAAMRELADMWIDSGKNPADPEVDTPSDRNTEDVLPGRSTSLFLLMSAVLFDRFPRFTGMRRDGTQGSISGKPHFESCDLENLSLAVALELFGSRWAMYWFAELLDSPYSHHLSRCDNCRAYFAYERARLRTAKHGVFCPNCAGSASVKRTESSRNKRFDTAAKAWAAWESKHGTEPQPEWLAEQVNKAHGTAFGRRWFSQHLVEIQERVEALRDAKG